MLIAFTGLAGSGKTAAANYLVNNFGFTKISFADPIKKMAMAYGLDYNSVYDPIKKELPIDNKKDIDKKIANKMLKNICLQNEKKYIDSLLEWWNDNKSYINTNREFMQRLGTEWGRNYHKKIWIEFFDDMAGNLKLKLSKKNKEGFFVLRDKIVCDDLRFDDEAKYIDSLFNSRIIKIINPNNEKKINNHLSELNKINYDHYIINNGIIEEFYNQIDDYMFSFNDKKNKKAAKKYKNCHKND